jgi:hypothetical protein
LQNHRCLCASVQLTPKVTSGSTELKSLSSTTLPTLDVAAKMLAWGWWLQPPPASSGYRRASPFPERLQDRPCKIQRSIMTSLPAPFAQLGYGQPHHWLASLFLLMLTLRRDPYLLTDVRFTRFDSRFPVRPQYPPTSKRRLGSHIFRSC